MRFLISATSTQLDVATDNRTGPRYISARVRSPMGFGARSLGSPRRRSRCWRVCDSALRSPDGDSRQRQKLVALSAPTLTIIVLGLVLILGSLGNGRGNVIHGVIGWLFLTGSFFGVFEIGRIAGHLKA